MEQEVRNIENFEQLRRKLSIMIAGRLRKKERMLEAIRIQDRLSKKSGSWNGAEEIRKWREKK